MSSPLEVTVEDLAVAVYYDQIRDGIPLNAALANAVKAYPAYASLLTGLAVQKSSEAVVPLRSDVDLVAKVAAKVVEAHRPKQLSSLLNAAQLRGFTPKALADELRLPISIVQKLNRRTISHWTIPRILVEQLADRLSETTDRIVEYLCLLPAADLRGQTLDGFSNQLTKEQFSVAIRTEVQEKRFDSRIARYWLSQPRIDESPEEI